MKLPLLAVIALFAGHAVAEGKSLALSDALAHAKTTGTGNPEAIFQIQDKVLSSYFQAVIADLEYQAAAEHVAMDFVRMTQRQKTSDGSIDAGIEIKAAEIRYRTSLERRWIAGQKQRLSRESIKHLTRLESPPEQLDPIQLPDISERLPPIEDLAPLMLKNNPQWRSMNSRNASPIELAELKARLETNLLEARLDLDRLLKGSLPRVKAEAEHADLILDKAREDIAAGRNGDIGYAMARTSDMAVKQAQVAADMVVAAWRLETLLGVPLKTVDR